MRQNPDIRDRPAVYAAIIFLAGVFVIFVDLADGRSLILDVDDQLRALQIQLFFSGQSNWHDLSIPPVRLPEVYVSPWSRLVDLPYILMGWTLAPLFGAAAALDLSFLIWPLVMLALYALLAAAFLGRLIGPLEWPPLRRALLVCIIGLMMGPALLEFTPGRIDHHNIQLLAMLGILVGLQRFDHAGAVLIGLCSSVSLLVGLECLPLIMAAYAGLVISWLAGVRNSDVVMGYAGAGFAVSSSLLGLIFVGPSGLLETACDAFSAPFALATLLLGLLLAGLGRWGREKRTGLRLLVLFLGAASILVSMIALYPQCLAGPYGMIDPLVRSHWLDRIPQEHGLIFQVQNGSINILPLVALPVLIAIWTAPAFRSRLREDPGLALALLVALVSVAAVILQMRYARFPIALMPLFIPVAAAWLLAGPSRAALGGAAMVSGAFILSLGIGALTYAGTGRDIAVIDTMGNPCDGADFTAITEIEPGRVLAPQGLGLPLIRASDGRIEVAAIPFHRGSPGLSTMFAAFLSDDGAVRRQALADFDYVAVCAYPIDAGPSSTSLYANLLSGKGRPGLTDVSASPTSPLRIFRIDHGQLQ